MFGPMPGSEPRFVAVTVDGDGRIVSVTDQHGLLGYTSGELEGQMLSSVVLGFAWSPVSVCPHIRQHRVGCDLCADTYLPGVLLVANIGLLQTSDNFELDVICVWACVRLLD